MTTKIPVKLKPNSGKIPLKLKPHKVNGVIVANQAGDLPYSYHPQVFPIAKISSILTHLASLEYFYTYYYMFADFKKSPRKMRWIADDPSWVYHFSHQHIGGLQVHEWTPEILAIKSEVEKLTGELFNAVLINEYQTGDSITWHSDDDPWFGNDFIVASVSFGAEMVFKLRLKADNSKILPIKLENGSVIVMKKLCQKFWQHSVPKQPSVKGVRYNLTFRKILPHLVHKQSKGSKMEIPADKL